MYGGHRTTNASSDQPPAACEGSGQVAGMRDRLTVRSPTLSSMQFPNLPQQPGRHYKQLLQLIHSRQDPKAALEAALAAVEELPAAPLPLERSPSAEPPQRDESLATMLDKFPRCKQLLYMLRQSPNNHNKTPVAILHEYATRVHREVVYTELSHSTVGPFEFEAKLASVNQEHVYAVARSQVWRV